MAGSLFPPGYPPTWQIPQALLKRRRPSAPAYPQSYAFDPVTGDFVFNGAGQVVLCSGRAAAAQRAAKAASTQQGAYTRIYRRTFGVNLEGALRGGRTRPQVEATLTDRISRGIRRGDARVRGADTFAFEWTDGNRVTATWTLILSDGTRVRQEVSLP